MPVSSKLTRRGVRPSGTWSCRKLLQVHTAVACRALFSGPLPKNRGHFPATGPKAVGSCGPRFAATRRPPFLHSGSSGVRKKVFWRRPEKQGQKSHPPPHGPTPPPRRSRAPSVRRPPAKAGRPRGRDPYGPSTGTSTVSATASGAFVSAGWPAAIPPRPGVCPVHSARGNSPGPTLCQCSCCGASRAARRPAASFGPAASTAVRSVYQAPSSVACAPPAVCRRWRLGVAWRSRPRASDHRARTATRTPSLLPCHLLATT